MTFLAAIVYGVVQGLTEFLPVSSSAHLILVPVFTGWPDPGLAFNVALHWGTLLAALIYFWKDILALITGFFGSIRGERGTYNRLPWLIVLATIPAVVCGLLLEHQAETVFRSPWVLVVTLSLLAVVLFIADRTASHTLPIDEISWPSALMIGATQALALIPGVSRSGITISAALFLGFQRPAAVRFSFLMSIPIILGAGVLESSYLFKNAADPMMWVAMVASAAAGLAAIHILITYVRNKSFLPFVVYRLALAVVIAGWILRSPA